MYYNYREQEMMRWEQYKQLEMKLDDLEERVVSIEEKESIPPTDEEKIFKERQESVSRLNEINRKERERKKKYDLEAIATTEYMHFCFWCNTTRAILRVGTNREIDVAAMRELVYTNEKIFVEYMHQEKPNGFKRIMPDFAIKKKMFEMFFGYIFEYDTLRNKWVAYKNT